MPAILHNDRNRNKVKNVSLILKVHRIDRVLGFFSNRPEGTHSLAGRVDGGVPVRTRGQTLWYSRYICTLCPSAIIDHGFIQQAEDKQIMSRISMAVLYVRA